MRTPLLRRDRTRPQRVQSTGFGSDPSTARPARVLIIDDNAHVCIFLTDFVASEGHRAVSIQDPVEGLRHIHSGLYDVAFVDLWMPGMGGLSWLRLVREKHLEIPVVLMTAYPCEESRIEALHELDALDYLTKPFDLETISRLIQIARDGRSPHT